MKRTTLFALALTALALAVVPAACGGSSPSPTATVTVTGSPANASPSPGTVDYTGMATENVIKLQRGLAAAGLYSGPVDGVYGPATEEAVKQAQTKLGVTPDGIWGPATSKAYQAWVKQHGGGQQPDAFVMQTQADLATLGYYHGKVDGYYGPATEAAVKAFQQNYGLPVTGKLDAATVNAISRAVTQSGATLLLSGPGRAALGAKVTLQLSISNTAGYSGMKQADFYQQQGGGWKHLAGATIAWTGSRNGSASLTVTTSGSGSGAFVYKATWQHPEGTTTSNQLSVQRTD